MTHPDSDPSRFRQADRQTTDEITNRQRMEQHVQGGPASFVEKLEAFPRYASRQSLARYFALYEIFKQVLLVQGDVIECGVNWGGGLMAFAQMSAILEPVNLQRRIIGFDTFDGFPDIHQQDRSNDDNDQLYQGGFAADCYDDLLASVSLYDANRSIGHVEKVRLIKGDACQTMPAYFQAHPHTVISLLHLDFDLYQPTKVAIEQCLPRMPAGAIIVFDELNNDRWPGETLAVAEAIGIRRLHIQRLQFEPHISYAILGQER